MSKKGDAYKKRIEDALQLTDGSAISRREYVDILGEIRDTIDMYIEAVREEAKNDGEEP